MNKSPNTSSTIKGLVILPVLSAFTFSSEGKSQVSVCDIDYTPTITAEPAPNLYEPYITKQDSCSSKTFTIDSNVIDLLVIKTFAQNYIKNLKPIEESIQAVIDDYFWEML